MPLQMGYFQCISKLDRRTAIYCIDSDATQKITQGDIPFVVQVQQQKQLHRQLKMDYTIHQINILNNNLCASNWHKSLLET
jgi:hypothetical protein